MHFTIRSATLNGYNELARSVGLDPISMVRKVGLDPACLSDPNARIDATAVAKLLEASAAESQAEDFGLQLSTFRRLSSLGPFSLVVREETTARRALETLGRYLRLHSEMLSIKIEDMGHLALLRVDIAAGARSPRRQGMELFVGFLFRVMRELLSPSWRPRQVSFMHAPPRSLSAYGKVFGCIVDFEAGFNGMVCSAEDLSGPLPTADPVMARYARQYLEAMVSIPDMTLPNKVRWLVREMLPLGRCSVEKVAQHLGVDRRTIHRHLERQHETFSSVVDQVRAELVENYLDGDKRSLTDVADLLGFSALSAFSRWHKRHFGVSLTERRRLVDAST